MMIRFYTWLTMYLFNDHTDHGRVRPLSGQEKQRRDQFAVTFPGDGQCSVSLPLHHALKNYYKKKLLSPPSPYPSTPPHRFVSLVLKASALGAEDPEFDSRSRRGDFSASCHTSDLRIDTPVATLPSAWRYRVSA